MLKNRNTELDPHIDSSRSEEEVKVEEPPVVEPRQPPKYRPLPGLKYTKPMGTGGAAADGKNQ